MGWMTMHRSKGSSNKEFFAQRFNDKTGQVLAARNSGSVCYLAYQHSPVGQPSYVTGIVCLTSWFPRQAFNFGYKTISEDMGPGDYNCPRAILELLTDPAEMGLSGKSLEWATQWRKSCWENLAAQEAKPKVKAGTAIQFANPITFTDDVQAEYFEWQKGSRFWQLQLLQDGSLTRQRQVQITNWRKKNYQLA
jgi:hypothetical protein